MPQTPIDAFGTFGSRDVTLTHVTSDTYHVVGRSAITAFDTCDGILLVDTGLYSEADELAAALRQETSAPIDTVLLTHGHMDHVYGVESYLLENQPQPEIIAHENMAGRFDRYARTVGYNEAINARQYGGTADVYDHIPDFDDSLIGWPDPAPTTWYSEDRTINVGEATFELNHGKGETDDHTWMYCPERDVLCSGDLFANVPPNAGNPQKVQRYPDQWAVALREMAELEPEAVCMGHFEPILGDSSEVSRRMHVMADFLEALVDRTLEQLNAGAPPHVDIIHDVSIPEVDEDWFEARYHATQFIIRNVIRYYGGWWNGRPSDLKPARRSVLASELMDLVGGRERILDRIEELHGDDELQVASHLADVALEARPDDDRVQDVVADHYERRSEREEDSLSTNLFAAASEYAEQGRPYTGS